MRPELQIATDAAREAGALTQSYFGCQYNIEDKGGGDPLTTADLAADALLKDGLRAARPDCGWLSEETVDDGARLEHEAVWIVDPIDGTREFVQGLPEYTICIAVVEQGVPTVGVIYNPARDELYNAVQGGGTFLNGKRVFCSEQQQLSAASSIVSRSEDKRGEIDAYRCRLGPITPIGSVAYELALVAAGKSDFNFSVQPKNEWDVCAGDLLVREAGGQMLDLKGQVRLYNQQDTLIKEGLVAGNAHLTVQMLDLLAEVAQ